MSKEWYESGDNVVFPLLGLVKHKCFIKTYKGCSYSQANRKMKRLGVTANERRAIIGYVKSKGYDFSN